MAAKLILETDVIDVACPPILMYGQPGVGKTSLGQTAEGTLTLDFDGGIHRSAFRKPSLRFDSWEDVIDVQKNGIKNGDAWAVAPAFGNFRSIVLDTVDTLLKYMGASIIRDNAKMGTRAGGLSLQGWGVLKSTFDNWIAGLRQDRKQLIFIAHQKEEKDGDNRRLRPDIAGQSYNIVMNAADIVGYMSYRNNVRTIYFEPTDDYFAKNGARLKSGAIPDFATNNHYLADLLTEAKKNLGHTAEASVQVAKAVEEWVHRLADKPTCESLNAMLPLLAPLGTAAKAQAKALIATYADGQGWVLDKAIKGYKEQKPIEPPQREPGDEFDIAGEEAA